MSLRLAKDNILALNALILDEGAVKNRVVTLADARCSNVDGWWLQYDDELAVVRKFAV